MPAVVEKRQAARPKPSPYNRKPKQPKTKAADQPKTSAKPPLKTTHELLTLSDWLEVVNYFDTHQPMTQQELVKYFATRPEGALVFTQSGLSHHLNAQGRATDQARLKSTPTALSMKRSRVVTRPDVDRALFLWYKHMEEKGECVTGPMLAAKRERFEKEMSVPEAERMHSVGWIPKFCAAYGLKEWRKHGEAGSVDQAAVAKEREHISKLLTKYTKRDRWNVDESGLFGL